MKQLIIALLTCICLSSAQAQMAINDESIRYQQERMVFKQWDKNKFTPTSGFLGLNPYYWLTWGLMPSYKNKDLRPLGPTGPQTQRLALAGTMNNVDEGYRKEADTLRNSAASEIAAHAGVLSGTDPLWIFYYSRELKAVTENQPPAILNSLPPLIRQDVIDEGLYDWHVKELNILNERLNGARTTNMDRGERIMAYHRLLLEYRRLEATWATRIASAVMTRRIIEGQQKVKSNQVVIDAWEPGSDIRIAREVLASRKY